MGEEELKHLALDIKTHGLKEPIWLYQGKILDGRNRWRACCLCGIEPRTQNYTGTAPASFVISLNLHRRHLTASQKAAVAVQVLPWFEKEARSRQGTRNDVFNFRENFPESEFGRARERASTLLGVNDRYISDCKTIKACDPALFEKVQAGQLTISDAKRELQKAEHAQKLRDLAANPTSAPPTGPFDLILADPPWEYDFCASNSREVENHYPTAKLEEICAHRPNARSNALLLLWATAPKLVEALQVMEAWSFDYVTSAVWDKEKPGIGYWLRGQHELLLVGVRGDFSPPIPSERVSSVFRSARQGYSAKPECVYAWIERAFPDAQKLEMYCRTPRPGWAVFGNEV